MTTTSLLKRTVDKISPFTTKFVKRQGEFAVRVSEIMKSTGMTQRQLAEKLGKKESYVSRILAGWANPTLKTITEFEVAIGHDIINISVQKKFTYPVLIKNPSWSTDGNEKTIATSSHFCAGNANYYINNDYSLVS
jgi:plasmid maintenance system antidote protein VapI